MREHDQEKLSKRTTVCRSSLASVDAKPEICLTDEIGAAACTPLRISFQSLQMHYDEQMLSCVVCRVVIRKSFMPNYPRFSRPG